VVCKTRVTRNSGCGFGGPDLISIFLETRYIGRIFYGRKRDGIRCMESEISVAVRSWGRKSRGNSKGDKDKDNEIHVRAHV
jgi:hypothetical protein